MWAAAAGGVFLVAVLVGVPLARRGAGGAIAARVLRRMLGRHANTGATFTAALAALWAPRPFASGTVLAVLSWLGDITVAGLLLGALGGGPDSMLLVVVPVLLANVAKMVPSTPGSIGVFEGVFAGALLAYGIPSHIAVSAAVLTHLLMNVFTLALGVPGALATGRALSRSWSSTMPRASAAPAAPIAADDGPRAKPAPWLEMYGAKLWNVANESKSFVTVSLVAGIPFLALVSGLWQSNLDGILAATGITAVFVFVLTWLDYPLSLRALLWAWCIAIGAWYVQVFGAEQLILMGLYHV